LTLFQIDTLPLARLLEELEQTGAASLPVLAGDFRRELLAEAKSYELRGARPVVGQGDTLVRQRMDLSDQFWPDSGFYRLAEGFQALLDTAVRAMNPAPFSAPVVFNDLMLQRYTVGSLGITPHRDRTAYRYLICLFVLAGEAEFGICADRQGGAARPISNRPGEVVLMRGPGCLGADLRPGPGLWPRLMARGWAFLLNGKRLGIAVMDFGCDRPLPRLNNGG